MKRSCQRQTLGFAPPARRIIAAVPQPSAVAPGVRKVIAISDQVAAGATPAVRDQMFGAFVRASQLEWMFWDSAYRLEMWPV